MKRLLAAICSIIAFFITTISCSTYSTARRPEAENIINAPIDVVWEKTLAILPTERMTLVTVNKNDYFIAAKKSITFWSWGDEVSIRLIPKGEEQTVLHMDAQTKMGYGDFGHEGRMVESIFQKIKNASER